MCGMWTHTLRAFIPFSHIFSPKGLTFQKQTLFPFFVEFFQCFFSFGAVSCPSVIMQVSLWGGQLCGWGRTVRSLFYTPRARPPPPSAPSPKFDPGHCFVHAATLYKVPTLPRHTLFPRPQINRECLTHCYREKKKLKIKTI